MSHIFFLPSGSDEKIKLDQWCISWFGDTKVKEKHFNSVSFLPTTQRSAWCGISSFSVLWSAALFISVCPCSLLREGQHPATVILRIHDNPPSLPPCNHLSVPSTSAFSSHQQPLTHSVLPWDVSTYKDHKDLPAKVNTHTCQRREVLMSLLPVLLSSGNGQDFFLESKVQRVH